MALINNKWRKDAGDNAVDALLRVAGVGLSSVLLTKVTSAEFSAGSNLKKTIGNIAGPAWSLMTLAGDIFLGSAPLRAFCQGCYSYGLVKSASVIAPVLQNYTGLKGLEEDSMPAIMNGVIMNGTDENSTTATPEEIQQYVEQSPTEEQQALTQVADYIEEGADDAVRIGEVAEAMLINN